MDRLLSCAVARNLLARLCPIGYVIRPVDATRDLDALASLGAMLSPSRREVLREAFRQEFAAQDTRQWLFLVAVDGQRRAKVLGFVRARRQGSEQSWWIAGLGVKPACRGRGIGEALVQQALERLREVEVRQVYLSVNQASRPAIELYRKLGFETEPPGDESEYQAMRLDLAGS
jgi:ribosomal protein S18 acetylase RimI-like enzyme